MFVIEARKGRARWISGLFRSADRARSFHASIPEDEREHHRLYELDSSDYPVYMIDDEDFRFVTADQVERALDEIERVDDEDHVYFNVYRFVADHESDPPGADEMGMLSHHHIINWVLDNQCTTSGARVEQLFGPAPGTDAQ